MKRIVFILCLAILSTVAESQQLTLETAIAIALKNNPGLLISKNLVEIAGINNNYGIAGGLPLVQSTGNVTQQMTTLEQKYSNPLNNKSSNNAPSNVVNAGVAASVPVFAGGKIVSEKHRLEEVEVQSKFQYSSRAQTLIYNVM